MKRFSYFLAALALVVSMQGCDNGPIPEPELPDNPDNPTQSAVQMHLKGNISAITPSTRVNADGFEANDKVGVYVSATSALDSSGNMLDNEAFTYAGGNITAPVGKEVYWGTPETKLSVWAYYPYAESISNPAAYPFAVATDQSDEVDYYNSDFITAQAANLAPQTTPVELTFNHSLSKINVTLVAGDGITAKELAEAEKNFYISGLATSGTIDLATGNATAGEAKEAITPHASGGVNYSAIVYPQQGEVTFRMEMNGEVYTYATDVDFEAGQQYQFKLTVNTWEAPEMTITTIAINPWEDGAEPELGTMSGTISFTDENLKRYIANSELYGKNENGEYVLIEGTYVDSNRDGKICSDEAKAVYQLIIQGGNIADLSGLEYFTNLEYLVVTQVNITDIDLSKNTSIRYVDFMYNNGPISLTLSNNPNLERIHCGGNRNLTTLDLSGATALKELACDGNAIESLDVSKNLYLNNVQLSSERSLSTLYVHSSQNTTDWRLPEGVTPTIKSE